MMVKVLGTGCAKCNQLYAQAEKAILESGKEVQLTKVDQIDEILAYGVMMTPALVVNEEVKSCGKIPATGEIVSWITSAS
ncbi:MAG: TM0996/MTH895 family glutaredoxin-like protein [Deltaproteobacteria bacterium]|nr:TM0996/MTH895 family glutaredoxin-like protein [Deltaproteobacteria bacterium]MBN2670281.1 TM0996/MTH895 family glutaredoxin-like protein [Deltaproteobacteria bacterium]